MFDSIENRVSSATNDLVEDQNLGNLSRETWKSRGCKIKIQRLQICTEIDRSVCNNLQNSCYTSASFISPLRRIDIAGSLAMLPPG